MGGLVWPRDQTTSQEAWVCTCFPLLHGKSCSTWGLNFSIYENERAPQGHLLVLTPLVFVWVN